MKLSIRSCAYLESENKKLIFTLAIPALDYPNRVAYRVVRVATTSVYNTEKSEHNPLKTNCLKPEPLSHGFAVATGAAVSAGFFETKKHRL